eukprot:GHVS01077147.1.p1 GENE.GHVS01077147.1~~GHVS01077147.1.p1  ORF type:complete len:470 (+),score=120.63 GHVS01077147.1:60-1469(+)
MSSKRRKADNATGDSASSTVSSTSSSALASYFSAFAPKRKATECAAASSSSPSSSYSSSQSSSAALSSSSLLPTPPFSSPSPPSEQHPIYRRLYPPPPPASTSTSSSVVTSLEHPTISHFRQCESLREERCLLSSLEEVVPFQRVIRLEAATSAPLAVRPSHSLEGSTGRGGGRWQDVGVAATGGSGGGVGRGGSLRRALVWVDRDGSSNRQQVTSKLGAEGGVLWRGRRPESKEPKVEMQDKQQREEFVKVGGRGEGTAITGRRGYQKAKQEEGQEEGPIGRGGRGRGDRQSNFARRRRILTGHALRRASRQALNCLSYEQTLPLHSLWRQYTASVLPPVEPTEIDKGGGKGGGKRVKNSKGAAVENGQKAEAITNRARERWKRKPLGGGGKEGENTAATIESLSIPQGGDGLASTGGGGELSFSSGLSVCRLLASSVDLVGAHLRVVRSACPSYVGLEGSVVHESER